jgi:pyruvate dehydrogenase E2 component (dihydrolipoamide acetyltransferase)
MAVEVFMPKMSDHMEVGEIIRWLVKEGDLIESGQVIMEVMTDKVVADLEAPASGILRGIRAGAEDGAIVPVGETFAFIAEPDEEVPVLPPLAPPLEHSAAEAKEVKEEAPPPSPKPSVKPVSAPPVGYSAGAEEAKAKGGPIRATPVARRIAKELGVDLSLVKGTGPEGRIKEEDVRAFAEAQTQKAKPPEATAVRASPVACRVARELGVDLAQVKGTGPGGRIKEEDVRAFAEALTVAPSARPVEEGVPSEEGIEWLDLNPIQRVTGQRMLESVQTAPQFALTTSVDVTDMLLLREDLMERVVAETGERLSITAILVKIVASALRTHPRANASFGGGRIKLHPHINVGVAVGTDDGLVVPVIKEADQKSLVQITQELRAFQDKAQRMHFSTDDLSGGTFTLSNLGMYGVDRFNAIINPPQSAILAVGRTIKTPVGMLDDSVALRPMMSLTLTVDHRSMDGVQGARFLAEVKERIEKPYFLL